MDIREGIYLLDSYFFDIIGKIYHTVPLHAINGNIASLKKFYRFLEANKVVPTGTYSRLNEEIRDKKDDWLMMARGIRPKERSYRGTRLIKLIKEYSKLSPWTRLTDLDVFAIEFSDEEDIFFCVVLGNDWFSYGLSIYRGSPGLISYLMFAKRGERIIKNPLVYADYTGFELINGEEITPFDYELIEKSGITFKDREKLPYFSIYKPGYLPKFPHDNDLRLMERILSVINPFLVSIKYKPEKVRLFSEGKMLLRKYDKFNVFISEHVMCVAEYLANVPLMKEVPATYDDQIIRRIKRDAKKTKALWEVDIFFPSNIMEINGEDVFPAVLMVVDKESRKILQATFTGPDHMEYLQLAFLNVIKTYETIPMKVQVLYNRNNFFLFDLFEKLSIDMEIVDKLEVIPQKIKEGSQFFVYEDS